MNWIEMSETHRWTEKRLSPNEVQHCSFGMKDERSDSDKCSHAIVHADYVFLDDGGSCYPKSMCSFCHKDLSHEPPDFY